MTAYFSEVNPVLPVRDVEKAVAYYTQRLGFRLLFQHPLEHPRYAGVERGAVRLHLQWHDEVDFISVEKLSLRFVVDDVDGLFTEYQDKDVFHARTAVTDTAWRTREFAFYDADGNGLFFYHNL